MKPKDPEFDRILKEFRLQMYRIGVRSTSAAMPWPSGIWQAITDFVRSFDSIRIPRPTKSYKQFVANKNKFKRWWYERSGFIKSLHPEVGPVVVPEKRTDEIVKAERAKLNRETMKQILAKKSEYAWTREQKAEFFASQEWRRIRYEVLRRDGVVCAACGSTDGKMHVDHIKPLWTHPELALDAGNLQVLCEDCNVGKGCLDETDWRIKS